MLVPKPDSPVARFRAYVEEHKLWEGELTLKRGQHLHMAGSRDGNIYHVEQGALRYYVVLGEPPQDHTIRFGYEGDFIMAVDTFFGKRQTRFNSEALRKTKLRRIKKEHLSGLLEDEELSAIWRDILQWMMIGQVEREIDLLTTSPEERYARVLARSPRLFQEIPAKYIANYLRMTPETLSRIRNS